MKSATISAIARKGSLALVIVSSNLLASSSRSILSLAIRFCAPFVKASITSTETQRRLALVKSLFYTLNFTRPLAPVHIPAHKIEVTVGCGRVVKLYLAGGFVMKIGVNAGRYCGKSPAIFVAAVKGSFQCRALSIPLRIATVSSF